MKKILLLAILLLTLLPQARVSAQDMINEKGYDCYDDVLGHYISYIPCDGWDVCRDQCSSCGNFYDCKNIKAHEKDCKYECQWCGKTMTVIEGWTHVCEPEDPEPDPPTPPYPSGPSSGGSGGGAGGGGGGGGTPPTSKKWKVGDYLKPTGCQTFFKDQIMIMPQQEESTDCVSTALAYAEMWANDYPLEKYEEVKGEIEDNFRDTYDRSINKSGAGDSIIVDFIAHHSGLVTGGLDIDRIKSTLDNGDPTVTILIVKYIDKGKPTAGFHLVPIIGYDCDDNYLYIDPVKKGVQTCTREDLEAYSTVRNQSCIFAVY